LRSLRLPSFFPLKRRFPQAQERRPPLLPCFDSPAVFFFLLSVRSIFLNAPPFLHADFFFFMVVTFFPLLMIRNLLFGRGAPPGQAFPPFFSLDSSFFACCHEFFFHHDNRLPLFPLEREVTPFFFSLSLFAGSQRSRRVSFRDRRSALSP